MFGKRWPLFRLLGIPVSIHPSWLIILAFLTFTLAGAFPVILEWVYPGEAEDFGRSAYWLMGLLAALAFFLCIVLHELGHAGAARARGIQMKGITLFLFGGVAETGEEPRSAGEEFVVAVSGPIVSVILAGLFWVLAATGYRAGWPPPVVIVLGYLAFINTMVLMFNLIPAFPLDGGRVLRAILWKTTGSLRKATWWATIAGEGFALVLIVWGALNIAAGNLFHGLWTCLIGLFLRDAARGSYEQVLVRQALEGEKVRRFMTPDPFVIPPSLDLHTWVEDFVYRHNRKAFPVVSEGRLEGYIETDVLAAVPRAEWDRHTVGELMRRDTDAISIQPDADAMAALEQMMRTGSGRLLVRENGRLVGILSQKDLLAFLTLKLELEPERPDRKPEGKAKGNVPSQPKREVLLNS
jgi:Zn-dependent protease/CBS domain-containing protein